MLKSPTKQYTPQKSLQRSTNHHPDRRTINLPRISISSTFQDPQHISPFKRSNTQSISLSSSFPEISAKSWILFHTSSSKVISEHRSRQKQYPASLTKMMTAICTISLCERFRINLENVVFRVTPSAISIGGTSANLSSYEWVSVIDLLYGLLLPSGNDAALVLAENLGALLMFERQGNSILPSQPIYSLDLTDDGENFEEYVAEFVLYMNDKIVQLELKNTQFRNPHGLDDKGHYSTCEDMLLLTSYFVNNELLSEIVNTRCYVGTLKVYEKKEIVKRRIYWVNTNKLLGKKGCKGVKTGYTQKAGGCLATLFEANGEQLMVAVMGSKSNEERFVDTLKLLNWAGKKFDFTVGEL